MITFMMSILILFSLGLTNYAFSLSLWMIMVLMLYFSLFLYFSDMFFNSSSIFLGIELSVLSWSLLVLTSFSFLVMILASTSILKLPNKKYLTLMWSLMITLFLSFSMKSYFWFYFIFESSLIPIFLIILGWGYQPERLSASISLFMYTMFASLPLLSLILSKMIKLETQMFYMMEIYASTSQLEISEMFSIIAILAFMVKFPLYGVHLWLPKAHVEAPVAGSMVLAAILLKLGGYGMIRFMVFSNLFLKLNLMIQMFSILGGALASFLCLRQIDMKILIAYSSVCHMSMIISALLMNSYLGILSALLMMLAHGISSSGMFMGANLLYENSSSRSLMISKSTMQWMPLFSLFWFFVCLGSMGGPPTINLLSEIYLIMKLVNISYSMLMPIATITFLAVAYTLIIYSTSQQGQKNNNWSISTNFYFCSYSNFSIHSFLLLSSIFLVLMLI